MNDFNEVTRDLALRALTASSRAKAGVRDAAIAMIRAGRGAGIAGIVWDSGPGRKPRRLVLVGVDGQEIYRFGTLNPFTLPQVGPSSTGVPMRRAALWLVHPSESEHEPRASA